MWKQLVSDYFNFSRKDRIGVLVLAGLVLAVWLLPAVLPVDKKDRAINTADSSWIAAARKMETQNESQEPAEDRVRNYSYQYDRSPDYGHQRAKGELFYFDPNMLSDEGWKKLGLRDKTIGTIRNYVSKGGQFRHPEDLSKIYGLFDDEYARLEPYIRIEAKEANNYPDRSKETFTAPVIKSERYRPIDINTADTSAYISLPGIGSKLAARIVNFRDKLGGFYSINQVGETYGLPDSTFQKIKQYLKLENTEIRKININTATIDELKVHPYIRYSLANPIVAYRKEHGPFAKAEDLKKVMAITEEIYNKIAPYLIIQ
jgi:competence protein ComEA